MKRMIEVKKIESSQQKRSETYSERKSIAEALSPLKDGTRLYVYEDAVKYYKKIEPRKFAPDEIILMLLGSIPDKPIIGKTMMMKQTFLTAQEFFEKEELQDPKFVGHKFGPHSFLIASILKNLEYLGLIVANGQRNSISYTITERGLQVAKRSLKKLSDARREKLKGKRIAWDELATDGILRFVYNNYPDYIDKSEIRYRYVIVDWKRGKK